MSLTLASAMGAAGWMLVGAALGILGTVLCRRLIAWREQRLSSDWDPY
jgi:hypothetical protein